MVYSFSCHASQVNITYFYSISNSISIFLAWFVSEVNVFPCNAILYICMHIHISTTLWGVHTYITIYIMEYYILLAVSPPQNAGITIYTFLYAIKQEEYALPNLSKKRYISIRKTSRKRLTKASEANKVSNFSKSSISFNSPIKCCSKNHISVENGKPFYF